MPIFAIRTAVDNVYRQAVASLLPGLRSLYRWRVLGVMLVSLVFLSGCVDYSVGVRFETPQRGEIVQRFQPNAQLKSLGNLAVQQWVETLEQRSQRLGGRTRSLPNQAVMVRIPFSNSDDLVAKFNEFFSPVESPNPAGDGIPAITSQMTVTHRNFILVEHERLRYDLDLRSLGVPSLTGDPLVSPASLFDLDFTLETPWGARGVRQPELRSALEARSGKELHWNLVPGEVNHLEAVFWLPSPLGIGALVIVLLISLGWYAKSASVGRSVTPQSP